MGSNWKDVCLGDISTIRRGSSPRPIVNFITDRGMPWVKIADATRSESKFINKTGQYLKEEGICKSVIVNKGDLILSNSGTAGLPKFMGITACIHDGWQVFKDLNGISSEFLYYTLIHIRSSLLHNAYDSTMKNLTLDMVRDAKIKLPPLSEQNDITQILCSLDNKIELNQKTNQTLEKMAQTLFKSWFVDFDPVFDNLLAKVDFKLENLASDFPAELLKKAEIRLLALDDKAKAVLTLTLKKGEQGADSQAPLPKGIAGQPQANIHKHFASEFEHHDKLGWIPKGWKCGSLEDMLILQRGFDLPKPKRNIGMFPLIVASGQDGTHSECKVKGPGVVTGRSGRIGVITFVHDDFWPLNTTLWIKEYKNSNPYHAYQLLSTLGLEQYNSGSAVPTLNRNHIHGLPLSVPPISVLNAYKNNVENLFSKLRENTIQEATLIRVRDTLLPKLISGELQIPDVKIADVETA